MNASPPKITDRQIVDYLSANTKKYQDLLEEIVKLARHVAEHPDTNGRVYRIYTRADKQTGNIFKEVWKIAEKCNGIMAENNGFQISQLGDIIGATIVVVYPSDIDVVRRIIDGNISEKRFRSHTNTSAANGRDGFLGEEKKSGGYYAHHYQLEVDDNLMLPHLKNARCELQIKTVLHDAWGAKTHDLTYKRAGALDSRMNRQVEVLGDVLAGIDQQSELLRHIIEGRWAFDTRKSSVAKRALLKKTLTHEDPSRQDGYLALRQRIIDGEAWLANKPTHDIQLQNLISELDRFSVGGRYNHSICQLFCLLAQYVGTVGMGKLAIDRVNSWKFQTTSSLERSRALRFLALAHFNFGDKVEAVRQCQEAIDEWHHNPITGLSTDLQNTTEIEMRNSLAYCLADLADSDAGIKMQAKERAARHLQEAKRTAELVQELPLLTRAMLIDTEGAVNIASAANAAGVREGLQLCKGALDLLKELPGDEAQEFGAFYELHEMRAFQRILDLEQGIGASRSA
jgi:ppGpp synthetase/RelA/SpoT-type nucleotidyltranferase